MIAPPPWRRGPQVRAPWHHRAMGPSTSWDQRPRPVTRAVGTQECTQIGQNGLSASFWGIRVHCWAVAPLRTGAGTQECTQIAENGLSAPFWGVCVHCWTVGLGCGWPWDRNSVHKWEDRASPRRFGAFVYTVGLWRRCGQARGRRSVHRSAKMASRHRFGAFVYTVAPWAWVVGGLGIAIVYTNGRIGPLGAGLGHSGTLLRHESRYELRRELRRVARAPQPPWRAGGAPSRWAPLPWSGRQTLRERRRREVGVFAETSAHTNPRGANSWASFPTIVLS